MEFWIIFFYEMLFQNFIAEINCLVVPANLLFDFQCFKLIFIIIVLFFS